MADFLALLALLSAMAFTPGPNTTLSTALAANHGLRGALPFIVAVPVGWLGLLLLATLGVAGAVRAWAPLGWAIQALGLGYLLWLAVRLWGAGAPGALAEAAPRVGFLQGVALQFVNIKAWLAALTVTAGWVLPAAQAPAREFALRLALVLATMAFYAFSSNFSYALAGALLRRWLAVGRRLQRFNRTMAAVLVATAAWLALAAPLRGAA